MYDHDDTISNQATYLPNSKMTIFGIRAKSVIGLTVVLFPETIVESVDSSKLAMVNITIMIKVFILKMYNMYIQLELRNN